MAVPVCLSWVVVRYSRKSYRLVIVVVRDEIHRRVCKLQSVRLYTRFLRTHNHRAEHCTAES